MSNTALQDQQNAYFLEVTKAHFKTGFEYGRPDLHKHNKSPDKWTDRSRTEQDKDGDGLKGVDCSALIWRGLKDSGFNVDAQFPTQASFTSAALLNGGLTDYAKEHFDVIQKADVLKPDALKPGDILVFKKGGVQHLAIFEKYDDKGRIEFFGSQTSTGPATSHPDSKSLTKDSLYSVLRPKAEFMKPEQRELIQEQLNKQEPPSEQEKPAHSAAVENYQNTLTEQLHDKLTAAGCSDKVAEAIIAKGVEKCAEQGAQEIKFAGIHVEKNLVIIQTDKRYDNIMYDAVAAAKHEPEASLQAAEKAIQQNAQQPTPEATPTQEKAMQGFGR